MKLFYYDIFLSGLTYVLLIYLAFRLMRKKGSKNSGDDGGEMVESPPKIDLPPGIIWPKDSGVKPKVEEEVLV